MLRKLQEQKDATTARHRSAQTFREVPLEPEESSLEGVIATQLGAIALLAIALLGLNKKSRTSALARRNLSEVRVN